ncbi:MAG TPA: flagellar biosynthesis anti-sigma factor FlgM [Candidatus Deferrimicrobiaceae bacterium]|jgi:anti-sigma28 factor (negative regulator of flagellin synthesis)
MKEAENKPVSSPDRAEGGGAVKKVAALRAAMNNGTYRVEPKKVADKIVKDAVRDIRSRLR